MNRRSAIRNLAVVAGGILILPSCLSDQKKGKASIKLTKLDLSLDDEHLLAEIGETLIPKTDIPGSKDMNLHLFAMKMVDDCYEKEDQEKFTAGLAAFQKAVSRQYKKDFAELTAKEKENFLQSAANDEALKPFYGTMKYRISQGFKSSKFVMSDLGKYELIPGRYNGYFPVKSKV